MSKNSIFLIFCFEIWFLPDGFLYQDISAAGREPQDMHPVNNSSFIYYSPCTQHFIVYYSPCLQHFIYLLFTLFRTFYLFIIHSVYHISFIIIYPVKNISFNYCSLCIQHLIYLLFTLYTTFHLFLIHPVHNISLIFLFTLFTTFDLFTIHPVYNISCSIFCCNVMSSMILIIYVCYISYLFQCWHWLSITVSFDFTCI